MASLGVLTIALHLIRLQPARSLVAAHGTIERTHVILVRVDSTTNSGWGECAALPTSGYLDESIQDVWTSLTDFLNTRVSVAPTTESLRRAISAWLPGQPVARAALEMATWDLEAKEIGRPLADHLGGDATRQIPAGATIGLHESLGELESAVADANHAGFSRIKVKAQPGWAVAPAMSAVAAAEGALVVVDCNGSFTATDFEEVEAMSNSGVDWIEQPFPPGELATTSHLRKSAQAAICLDEDVVSALRVEQILDSGAADALAIKPGRLGGHESTLSIVERAHDADIACWIGGMLETGVGRAHNLALASLPGFTVAGDMAPSSHYLDREIVDPPWKMRDGHFALDNASGIGVLVDTEYIRAHTTHQYQWSN